MANTAGYTPEGTQSRTISVEEAARMLGVSRWAAYQEIAQTDQLAGVRVIRIGRRILIPREALDRVLSGKDGA